MIEMSKNKELWTACGKKDAHHIKNLPTDEFFFLKKKKNIPENLPKILQDILHHSRMLLEA